MRALVLGRMLEVATLRERIDMLAPEGTPDGPGAPGDGMATGMATRLARMHGWLDVFDGGQGRPSA